MENSEMESCNISAFCAAGEAKAASYQCACVLVLSGKKFKIATVPFRVITDDETHIGTKWEGFGCVISVREQL
jgi:hypothetical protein